MKRCPECRKDYFDDTLMYCLDDGVALIQGTVIFIPSRDGISHSPREYSAPADITNGANVLLHTLVRLDAMDGL